MLVSCSACSAKFQLPDDKIRGRKARMKCKTCGASIAIDGTDLAGSVPHAPPPPPSRRPQPAAKHEVLSFSDQTVALGPGEAEALSRQAREAERAVAPDLEDRITPVSNPRAAASLLDDGYVDAAMDALEQKVFSVPAPHPAPPPSKTSTGPKAGDDDEATRMMDLPRLLSGQPAADAPPALKSAAPDGDGDEATRMMDLGGPAGLLGSIGPRRADKDGEEATRIFDAEPVSPGPRLPPRPSLPRAPGAPPAPSSTAAAIQPPVVVSDPGQVSGAQVTEAPNPLEISTAKVDVRALAVPGLTGPGLPAPHLPPAPGPPAPHTLPMGEALSGPPAAPEARPGRPAADVTAQRARIPSTPPPPPPSNWGVYLFLVALAATGSLVGVYFFSRPTFDQAISSTRQALGLASDGEGDGPAFNARAATSELERVAARAPSCKVADGPTGAGRARVLFQMNGTASSAAVSQPFHGSTSETCLLGLFKSAKVPAFGGKPVIVTKTFRVD